MFRERGVKDFMIQAGGDLYVGGTKDGRPWNLGINDPARPGRIQFRDGGIERRARSAHQVITSVSSCRTAFATTTFSIRTPANRRGSVEA